MSEQKSRIIKPGELPQPLKEAARIFHRVLDAVERLTDTVAMIVEHTKAAEKEIEALKARVRVLEETVSPVLLPPGGVLDSTADQSGKSERK